MTFNFGAIPFALAAVAVGVGVWVFRLKLTQFSDRAYGRKRSLEAQERYARLALIPLVWCLLLAGFALFIIR